MKRILLFLFLSLFCLNLEAQTYKVCRTKNYHNSLKLNTATGSVVQVQDDGQSWTIVSGITPSNQIANRYVLYETQNIWNFILLDTWSGKLWQVQFSVKGTEYMGYWTINDRPLSTSNKSKFYIEPMVSMYQYYLVNGDNGEMWKFQWSTQGSDYRWIEKW